MRPEKRALNGCCPLSCKHEHGIGGMFERHSPDCTHATPTDCVVAALERIAVAQERIAAALEAPPPPRHVGGERPDEET